MIKRFGFRNFSSFKDGAEVNFTYSKRGSEDAYRELEISTVLGVKGANGSGKTNILKALVFLHCFCARKLGKNANSSSVENDVELPFETFFDNKEVTEFYIELLVGNTTYYYELDITQKGIVREELRRKNKKEVTCIIRKKNKVVESLKEFHELKSLKLKADQSIISVTSDYDFHEKMIDLKRLRLCFTMIQFNVGASGYKSYQFDDYFEVSKFYHNNPKALDFAKQVISGIDEGVQNIEIEETVDKLTGEAKHSPIFIHKNDELDFPIGLAQESMGTKSLFLNLCKYWLALKDGSVLVLDEFDTHLHAMILPEIIELFTNKRINNKGAQLVITAHNTEVIDALGRYRVLLVNKENNESYCYRLDEVSLLRNDRLIAPVYSKGKIGGTPKNIRNLAKNIADEWGN